MNQPPPELDPQAWLGLAIYLASPFLATAAIVFGIWWITNPLGATLSCCRMVWRLIKSSYHHPWMSAYTAMMASQYEGISYQLRIVKWLLVFVAVMFGLVGAVVSGVDLVLGPERDVYYRRPNGQLGVRRERRRVHSGPRQKLDKTQRELTPHRNRAAYWLQSRHEARRRAELDAGVVPTPMPWWQQRIVKGLKVEKQRIPKGQRKAPKAIVKGARTVEKRGRTMEKDWTKSEAARLTAEMRRDAGGPYDQEEAYRLVQNGRRKMGALPPPPEPTWTHHVQPPPPAPKGVSLAKTPEGADA